MGLLYGRAGRLTAKTAVSGAGSVEILEVRVIGGGQTSLPITRVRTDAGGWVSLRSGNGAVLLRPAPAPTSAGAGGHLRGRHLPVSAGPHYVGTVLWFDDAKKFGFIRPDAGTTSSRADSPVIFLRPCIFR
jgi:hypothetical protein